MAESFWASGSRRYEPGQGSLYSLAHQHIIAVANFSCPFPRLSSPVVSLYDYRKPAQAPKLCKEISIPTCWNDLDTTELHAIAKNLISQEADKPEGRAKIFMTILRHRIKLQGDKMPRNREALLNLDDCSPVPVALPFSTM